MRFGFLFTLEDRRQKTTLFPDFFRHIPLNQTKMVKRMHGQDYGRFPHEYVMLFHEYGIIFQEHEMLIHECGKHYIANVGCLGMFWQSTHKICNNL